MPLVEHPLTRKIAFTGSDATGRLINEAAARGFKKVGLELGGKSPNIVFDDAILDDAVNGAVSGIFAATGQTCIAGSRLLLQDSIHDQFVEKLLALAKTARMGNPHEPRHAGRPGHHPAAIREGPVLHRRRQERGREAAPGRRAGHAPRVRQGLVRRADHLHRRRQPHAHRAGGDLRPGAVDHPVQGRRRGGAHRQRRALRPGRGRVDARHRRAPSACPSASRPARCGSTPIAR